VTLINFVYLSNIIRVVWGGWVEYLILSVSTRPNEKQRQSCKYFLVDYKLPC
jgi:hypothetical protein